MSKKTPPQKAKTSSASKPRSVLSADDDLVWQHFASGITPLPDKFRSANRDQDPAIEDFVTDVTGMKIKQAATATPSNAQHRARRANETARPLSGLQQKQPDLAQFQAKTYRRVGAQRTQIDATLDLHGFRQDQAYTQLKRFLIHCQNSGFRYALVITGKGTKRSPQQNEVFVGELYTPGVLKRSVPEWLEEDALRDLVVSYRTAHPHHGGEGALYVHVRKKKEYGQPL